MGINKAYLGYKAFQYLEKGKDYVAFKLADELARVEPYQVPLPPHEESRARKLAEECTVISLHDHPVAWTDDMQEVFEYNKQGRHCTAYEGLSVSCLDAVFDNLMDGVCTITSKGGWTWTDIIYDLGMRLSDLAHQDFVIKGERLSDIVRAHDEGKVALIPSLESSTMIENEIDRIDILYGFGVRMMGLVYSESNALGSGLKEEGDGGLTYLGHRAIERMNKIGMAIDVAHCGERTAMDAIKRSEKPVFISHIGAKALWDIKRMASDDLLKACADHGGVLGVEAAPHTTVTTKNQKHSIDTVMDHFEYIKDLVGIDYVGFGPDVLYGDHFGLHHVYSAHLSMEKAYKMGEVQETEYVKGMENPSEASWNIIRWLIKQGYSDNDIEKVVGGNILRVLRDVWF
jgi:membrane dipeptidase